MNLKEQKLDKNIVLIGMPGSGKSTIGYKVAKITNKKYIDLDNYIEKREKKTISELFEHGEKYFRDIETDCIKEVCEYRDTIISSGGGVVLKEENMNLFKKNSIIIYIERDINVIRNTINTSKRPLLKNNPEKLIQIYKERKSLYKKYCEYEIKNNWKMGKAIHEIIQLIKREEQMKIYVINGSNLNFLGIREKDIYGEKNYDCLCNYLKQEAKLLNIDLKIFQSNIEGEIINYIQDAYSNADGIVINPGAYTHYSYAIMDALQAVNLPAIEVHLSNIYKRDEFRHKSVTASACMGQISGLGFTGYKLAMQALCEHILQK